MKLYEYQAKELFREAGIPTPEGVLIDVADGEALPAGQAYPCVLKSQVLTGGRGKAGLIRFPKDARAAATALEALRDRGVRQVLIEPTVDIAHEVYAAITVDPLTGRAVFMACAEGGVEIEELAKTKPEAIVKEPIDLRVGLQAYQARDLGFRLDPTRGKELAGLFLKMWAVFKARDAELVEINPLFVTGDGSLIAGDGKVIIDDNAAFRQPSYVPGRDYYDSDAEYEAAQEGIPYLQFDGDISLMCAGAGLTTTVYDLINYEGGSVANYLEFGGPNYRKAQTAMELCLKNDSKVILIVTFGTIARADVMATGVVEAMAKLKPDRPIVTCIRGTNEEEAWETLRAAGLEPLADTEEAVRTAVALCREGAA